MAVMMKNSPRLKGDMPSNFPRAGIKMDAAMIKKELSAARIRYLFLKIPTFMAG